MSQNPMETQTQSPTETTSDPNAKPRRNRLNAEGVAILEDQWKKNPGEIPSLALRKSLTDQVKRTPGNDFYKLINTTDWFKRRLQKSGPSNDPRFPSLTPSTLENLNRLLKEQRNPSPELITTWASLLASTGATYQDVVAWVHIGLRTTQSDHLPTPADTITPEPSLSPSSPTQPHHQAHFQNATMVMKKDPTQSPVVPPISVQLPQYQGNSQFQVQTQFHHYRSPVSPTSPVSPGGGGISQNQHPRVPALQAIMQGVADAVASSTNPPDVLPSSAAEFNAMFAPYEKQLSQLIHALENP